jgi:hypothetical protein
MKPRDRFHRESAWLTTAPDEGWLVEWRARPGQCVVMLMDGGPGWEPGGALTEAILAAGEARPGWFDGAVVRVSSMAVGPSGLVLRLRPTRYAAYLGGAWAVAHLPAHQCRAAWAAFDRGEGRLPALQPGAALGHTLGVSALVEVGDEVAILRQHTRAVASAGVRVPSASGAAEPPRRRAGAGAGAVLESAAEITREIEEELGIPARDLVELAPLGLLRDAQRGGKPELFYRARAATTRWQTRRSAEHMGSILWMPARHRADAPAAWSSLLATLSPSATVLRAAAILYGMGGEPAPCR